MRTEPPNPTSESSRPFGFGRASLVAASLGSAVIIAWLGWSGVRAREAMHVASQRAVRVAELRGSIVYLGEFLTMSARMATATGDKVWVERYDEAAPKLDAAVAEAAELATPEVKAAMVATTEEAHRDLTTMERRSLALAAGGDLPAARRLLDSPEFTYLQDVYASGIDIFGQDLTTLAGTQALEATDRAGWEVAGLGLCALLGVAAVLTMRGRQRLKGALAHTAAVARIDTLTELPNRRGFYDALDAAAERAGTGHALLLIDLDRFKAANDVHGHVAGDRLLQVVADRLRGTLRPGDDLARLGGDEFGLLMRLDGPVAEGCDAPRQRAERVIEALNGEIALPGDITVQVGGSVGLAVAQPGAGEVGELMHRADLALQRAKADGRGCCRVYLNGMDEEARARAEFESELRQAVADDAIVPYFQPLVEMDTGRPIGVEMLARWPHPTWGMVSPVQFIPVVENLGLVGAMTDNLIRRACRAAASWPEDIILACNISPLQLRDPDLHDMVRRTLEETGLPAHRLELEITENALVGDLDLARSLLRQLKALGVRLALDDFGTGYSSLRHLKSLPFDKLKIDASFVRVMADDEESRKIVSAVIGLGRSLGLTTVAEGVETEDIAALLRGLGCDVGQGWLFGRPAAVEATTALLARSRAEAPPLLHSAA